LLKHPDLNHQELGSYALERVYSTNPGCIEPEYLNLLADGEIYPFRCVLGDLLLGLALQDVNSGSFDRLGIMNTVNPSSAFWNPVWKYNRMDVCWLQAINYFARSQEPPAERPRDVREDLDSLLQTEKQRQQLLARPGVRDSQSIQRILDSYYRLGVGPEQIRAAHPALRASADSQAVFKVLLAHPLWAVGEAAASVLASIVDDNQYAGHRISDLFGHDHWRVQFGAAEAAFLARFKDKNRLFRQAVATFHQHPEPLLRGNCAENLTAWILDSSPNERTELLREFELPLGAWLRNDEEECWVLDHIHRLFRTLILQGHEADCKPLLDGGVSYLLAGDPTWYALGRQDFLRRIEERRRARRQANGLPA
jgi:hypothetical protein